MSEEALPRVSAGCQAFGAVRHFIITLATHAIPWHILAPWLAAALMPTTANRAVRTNTTAATPNPLLPQSGMLLGPGRNFCNCLTHLGLNADVWHLCLSLGRLAHTLWWFVPPLLTGLRHCAVHLGESWHRSAHDLPGAAHKANPKHVVE